MECGIFDANMWYYFENEDREMSQVVEFIIKMDIR